LVEKFDDIVLNKKIKEEVESFVKYSKDLKGKTGLIDPFQLVDLISIDDLKKILKNLNTDNKSES